MSVVYAFVVKYIFHIFDGDSPFPGTPIILGTCPPIYIMSITGMVTRKSCKRWIWGSGYNRYYACTGIYWIRGAIEFSLVFSNSTSFQRSSYRMK